MSKTKGKIFDFKLFEKLMDFVNPYKTSYYLVMFFAICLSSFSILTPYLLKITVDDYITKKDYEDFIVKIQIFNEIVESIINENKDKFECYVANDNSLGQIVLSGKIEDLEKMMVNLKMHVLVNVKEIQQKYNVFCFYQ